MTLYSNYDTVTSLMMSCLNCMTVMKMEQLSSDSIKALGCWLTAVTCHIQRLFLQSRLPINGVRFGSLRGSNLCEKMLSALVP